MFHVAIAVRVLHDVDPDKIKQLGTLEHERANALQRQGKWLHLWRVAGEWANVSVFKVESPAELHEILEALPLAHIRNSRSQRYAGIPAHWRISNRSPRD
jgi:muconolactone D-isomerase